MLPIEKAAAQSGECSELRGVVRLRGVGEVRPAVEVVSRGILNCELSAGKFRFRRVYLFGRGR